MNKSYLIAALILILSFLWIGSGLITPDTQETPSETEATDFGEENEIQKVRVINSEAQDYTTKIKVSGRSKASKNVTLRAESEGQVLGVVANEGDAVESGAPIVKIDIRERENRVLETSELVKQRQIEYDAARKLIKQGYTSDVRLAQAQSELESARASMKMAEIDLAKTTISAPFDGVLGLRHIDVGDYVKSGDAVVDIVDLDPMKVTVFVNEKDVVQITKGASATVRFAGGEERNAIVEFIAPAADEQSRTFQVDVAFDNAQNTLPAGLTAAVSIDIQSKKAHKISPAILSLNDEGDIGVKAVQSDNTIQFMPVTIIADYPDHMWVKGLPDQIKIVTVGQDFVMEGQTVDPITAER